MSVYRRHKKEKDFTQIDNCVFRDKSLSMKAKGLLTQIYSLPDDWSYSIRGLASLFKDGKEAVNNALNELIEHGYIVRTQRVGENGQYDGYEYDIYETPQAGVSEKPFTENPITENPITESQTVSISNISNTKVLNTNVLDIPPISPLENLFEQFWVAYPQCFRKANKKGCKAKFLKIKNLESIFSDIMASLEMQKRSKQWNEQDGQFIPAPLTWINQERWTVTDERTELQQKIDEATQQNISGFLF